MTIDLRPARMTDVPELKDLIERSARALSVGYYSETQIESAVRFVFGVDSSLLADGTYYVALEGDTLVGCGGWSKRGTLYGGDQRPMGAADLLDPKKDAARIRAFFVSPGHARKGIGRILLDECERAARAAGFQELELMATLPGVPLYEACGFHETARMTDILPDGIAIEFVRMTRLLDLEIRAARLEDAEAIGRIHVDSWRATYRGLMPDLVLDRLDVSKRAAFWRQILSSPHWPVYVVDEAGSVMGFCSIAPANDPDLDSHVVAQLMAIYLDPGACHKGYGRQLCEQAMAEAVRRGCTSMALWVLEANAGARAFYEKLGFAADGERKIDPAYESAELRYRKRLAIR